MPFKQLPLIVFSFCYAGVLLAQEDQVINALRKEPSVIAVRNERCTLLAEASGFVKVPAKLQKAAVEQFADNLRKGDVQTLRARGDAARLGLFGIKQNIKDSMRFYQTAAQKGSPESSYNIALYLFQQSNYQPNQNDAKKILSLLSNNTNKNYNVKNDTNSFARFIEGQIYQNGWAGEIDSGKAFLAYRSAARSGYVPAVYQYLQYISVAYPKASQSERRELFQEINILTGRWNWASTAIMRITGDFHAMNILPDENGFSSQYHWRLAKYIADQNPNGQQGEIEALRARIKTLDPRQEHYLEIAIQSAIKNNQVKATNDELRFISLCS